MAVSGCRQAPLLRARVLTLYPEMFPGVLGFSVAGKALTSGVWALETVDIRGFARDKHGTVDDMPFGGGAGMVMRADVLADAIDATIDRSVAGFVAGGVAERAGDGADGPLIYFSPRGQAMDQSLARRVATAGAATLVCGRFEGIDERVLEARDVIEVSLGDFVLSGGEIAALALLDAAVRLLPGVAGNAQSLAEESFERGLLEYPQYTRPRVWEGRSVPTALLSGHHAEIRAWRLAAAERITRERRPDLWHRYVSTNESKKVTP